MEPFSRGHTHYTDTLLVNINFEIVSGLICVASVLLFQLHCTAEAKKAFLRTCRLVFEIIITLMFFCHFVKNLVCSYRASSLRFLPPCQYSGGEWKLLCAAHFTENDAA